MNRRSFLGLLVPALAACQRTLSPVVPKLPVLRVMTDNLHHGEGIDGKLDLGRIAVSAGVIVPQFGRIRWAGVHLDASRDDTERWEQVGALIAEFDGEKVPARGRDSSPRAVTDKLLKALDAK